MGGQNLSNQLLGLNLLVGMQDPSCWLLGFARASLDGVRP